MCELCNRTTLKTIKLMRSTASQHGRPGIISIYILLLDHHGAQKKEYLFSLTVTVTVTKGADLMRLLKTQRNDGAHSGMV